MSLGGSTSTTMRGIAVVETVKGLSVASAGCGALRLLHHDAKQVAIALVTPAPHRSERP